MEIKGIRIENFKSYGEDGNSVDNLSNFNIFIGKNNTGKSTIMQVLELIFWKPGSVQIQLKGELMDRLGRKGKISKVYLDVVLSEKELKPFMPDDTTNTKLGPYRELRPKLVGRLFTIEFAIKNLFSDKKQGIIYLKESEGFDQECIDIINRLFVKGFVDNLIKAHEIIFFPAIRNVRSEPGETNNVELYPDGNRLTLTIKRIITDHSQDEAIVVELLRGKIKEFFPEMGDFAITVKGAGGLSQIFFGKIPLTGFGTGIMDVLLILANITIREALGMDVNFICIEEPENNLHPQLQCRLLDYLKSVSNKGKQIFISTHSPYFIQPEDIGNLYRFGLKEGNTVISSLKQDSISQLDYDDIVRSIRPDNCCAFFADKVILVEGIQDRMFLSHVMNEFRGKSHNISFIQCNGSGEIPRLKRLFDSFGVEAYAICDSHCLNEPGIINLASDGNAILVTDDENTKREKLSKCRVFALRRHAIQDYFEPPIPADKAEACNQALKKMKKESIVNNSKVEGSDDSEFKLIFDSILETD